ncbi:TSUP family transporter [Altererythrobacter indicus]|uniref:Probable membrane transporter protein n=1 Tax=Altericroceibacterium indicum TaxID=374177 RepID=A0A845A8A1_9SPHN|nr:TSUP family transporter [Altericroceibacterium indicum]MXP25261.1 TSUP family transporter [Altericroceibacterium indicum]
MELPIETLIFLVTVAFMAGGIDAMAGGGGLLTIPALMAAGVPPVSALATNKLQSSAGTASAFVAFWRAGHIDLRRFAWPVIAAIIGSGAGAVAVQQVDPSFLSGIVPLLLILMCIYFIASPKMGAADRRARISNLGLTLLIGAIGFYDGFFGPGTGSFLTTALVALAGLGLLRAIANAKLLNLATNLAGLVALIAGGQMLWLLGFSMAAANVAGNQVGARLAIRYGGAGVRPLLVIMSAALTIKLLSDPANPIWHIL